MTTLIKLIMISTVRQLNAFIDLAQVKSKGEIVLKLIEKQERISADMAKLIVNKL